MSTVRGSVSRNQMVAPATLAGGAPTATGTPEKGSVPAAGWVAALEKEVEGLLGRGETAVMEALLRRFEKALILKALAHPGARRIEASQLLGLGRNTLTRKIQELGIDSGKKGE